MTLRQKAAQLVVIRTYGDMEGSRSRSWRDITSWVRDLGVGGVIVVNRVQRGAVVKAQPFEAAQFLNHLQKLARIPLLAAGDFERSVSMRFEQTIPYPHAMAYAAAGDPALTRELGAITAREARALGFHWVFAPDADVNNNPANPIIGIRSFGSDPGTVSAHVRAFIAGAHSVSPVVMLSAKHFPGHGDTDADSHNGLPVIPHETERLDSIELPPFQAAISEGVDSVMTAHVAMPQIDAEGVPATISRPILTGILRGKLGFSGIITTDAMDMDALARQYGSGEASVRALEAGADVLLMPRNPEEAVAAIVKAVLTKRLPMKRIEESVRRILEAKVRLGLHRGRTTNLDAIAEAIDNAAGWDHAQRVADKAVAVLGGRQSLLPLQNTAGLCVFALAERRGNGQGLQLQDECKVRAPQAAFTLLDPQWTEPAVAAVVANAATCSTIVVAAFRGFGGTAALSGFYPAMIEQLAEHGKPLVFAALGSPYISTPYKSAALRLTTYSTVPPSETALAKVLFGELPATGKLVATLPE
jgi:beta-N-acetylhexosaminidase